MTEEWLSLSAAAKLLGVHPSTVRLWSDKGALPTHKTQGGHRRYKRSEIALWADTRLPDGERESQRAAQEYLIQEIMKTVRVQISEGNLEAQGWYKKMNEEARAQYRLSGRSLFQGLMAYIGAEGDDAASEAYAVGYEYASRARRYHLDYVDAVKAFLFFRDSLIKAFIKVYVAAKAPADHTSQMYLKMHAYTDEILVSLLQTYHSLESAHR
ncbi:MAG: helix-turn-helix domain-containing protein [Anaerolineales bacterium]